MTKTREEIEFEKRWGVVCDKCKKRKGTLLASAGAEPGKNSICKCKS